MVDELCAKLRDLEGVDSNDEKDECRKTDGQPKTSLESLTPRDKVLRYYAAFPALQPATPKKSLHRKDKNFGNTNNNNNIKNHGFNNINKNASNKTTRQKKSKMSVVVSTENWKFSTLIRALNKLFILCLFLPRTDYRSSSITGQGKLRFR